MSLPQKTFEIPQLYRLILDHALDSFIAIDEYSAILEWSKQAEETFGWARDEVLGLSLTETIIPERYHAAHITGLRRYLQTGTHNILGRRVELFARRKDDSEIPVELTVTPISETERPTFSASLRDISKYKTLEKELQHQVNITNSILDNMADAVAVSDLSGHMLLVNPAAQRLWNIESMDDARTLPYDRYQLFQSDGTTPCPANERPMTRALHGEQINAWIGFIRHSRAPEGIWVSINARPLIDDTGTRIGAVAVYHDITEIRQREQALERQGRLLREQASLLDVTPDAVLARDDNDVIVYWNRSAEALYGFSSAEAIGKNSHALLKTQFPMPLDTIADIVNEKHYWEGELTHESKSGRKITVSSQWTLDTNEPDSCRYLETNTDITQRVNMERAIRQTQENYRLLVETSTEFAMIIMDPEGIIVNWNIGAEKILGLSPEQAIGHPISNIFTPEDRNAGHPWHELEKAKATGRTEDMRWHIRKDGSRFWGSGVAMPLWNENGNLHGFTKILRDQTAQRVAEEQTQFIANHDILTGLPNRVQFSEHLHRSIAMSDRNHTPLAILLLDLDRFKYVNDTFGHHVGDLLLEKVAQRLTSSLRKSDFVARLGGDEFVVVQTDALQPQAAETLAGNLIAELGHTYQLEQYEIQSGASIGISVYPVDADNTVDLMKRSDLALYRAKGRGRGTYHVYTTDLLAENNGGNNREQDLRDAFDNHHLELYYQPQVNLDDWTVSTVEALLRWQTVDQGLVLPNDFLDVAEETGLIIEIGQWSLRNACRQVRQWQTQGMSNLRISVNCSTRQFSDPEFVKMVGPILNETGLAGTCLELEIMESMLASPDIQDHLVELRRLGVRIIIDNYGTGATTLVDLKQFEIDGLKIDKTFVQDLPHNYKDSAITESIISLAHNLGIHVSAGGVETPEQLAYLKSKDCNNVQGFILSPPLTAVKFEELMLSGHWSRINQAPSPDDASLFKNLH